MISRVVVRSAGERWLQTPRKVVPFRQKGGTFPGPIRLVTSDKAKLILF